MNYPKLTTTIVVCMLCAVCFTQSLPFAEDVVPTANDQSFAAGRKATDSESQTLPVLAPMPSAPSWPEDLRKELNLALSFYPTDCVYTYLTFRDSKNKNDYKKLSDEQRKWIEATASTIRPNSVTMLNRDVEKAKNAGDLRNEWLSRVVLMNVKEGADSGNTNIFAQSDNRDHLLGLAQLLAEAGKRSTTKQPVWKVSQVEGLFLKEYKEDWTSYGLGWMRVTPENPADKLLRVTAKLKNVSKDSDQPHNAWGVTSAIRGALSNSFEAPDRFIGGRFIGFDSIWLLPDGSKPTVAMHVGKNSQALWGVGEGFLAIAALRGGSIEPNKHRALYMGSFVKSGDSIDIDVTFALPENVTSAKLFVLGADPVSIHIKKESLK